MPIFLNVKLASSITNSGRGTWGYRSYECPHKRRFPLWRQLVGPQARAFTTDTAGEHAQENPTGRRGWYGNIAELEGNTGRLEYEGTHELASNLSRYPYLGANAEIATNYLAVGGAPILGIT